MPVLSTTYLSSAYSSGSSPARNGSTTSSFSSLRPYSSSSLSHKSRSSYDLTQYRPANYLQTHPISTSSYKPPSSSLSTNYYSNRYSSAGISGKLLFVFSIKSNVCFFDFMFYLICNSNEFCLLSLNSVHLKLR